MLASTLLHAQMKYTVDKVAHVTTSTHQLYTKDFSPKRFTAYLYKDALVFDGFDKLDNPYYKFVRVIDTGDPEKHRWNATDRYGNACQITIQDFGDYTLISVKYLSSDAITVYQTL